MPQHNKQLMIGICVALVWQMIIQSDRHFLHVTITTFFQIYNIIGSLQQIEFWKDFNHELINSSWNALNFPKSTAFAANLQKPTRIHRLKRHMLSAGDYFIIKD